MSVSEALLKKYSAQVEQAKALGNEYPPDLYGRFPWDRSERRGAALTLSKSSLGIFVHAVLSNGGDVTSFFTLNYRHPRASVFSRVWLSVEAKRDIEASTAFRFDPPATIKAC